MPNITPIVRKVQIHILDVHDNEINLPWCEGYISALANHDIINEREFDLLLKWIQTME